MERKYAYLTDTSRKTKEKQIKICIRFYLESIRIHIFILFNFSNIILSIQRKASSKQAPQVECKFKFLTNSDEQFTHFLDVYLTNATQTHFVSVINLHRYTRVHSQ